MMAGKRVSLGSIAGDSVLEPATSATSVSLQSVAANPLNPRGDLGNLSELIQSLETVGQLQPCTAVTKLAYLSTYPEHREHIGEADYVVIMGGRRLAAAQASTLIDRIDIAVKDQLAKTRQSLAAAAVIENIERRDFDPVEEARAVQRLVDIFDRKQDVARHLSRSNGWITQRLTLLRLAPGMQELVRAGELPVRDARELAKFDPAEQPSIWERRQSGVDFFTAVKKSTISNKSERAAALHSEESEDVFYRGKKIDGVRRAVGILGSPDSIAEALRAHLAADDCKLVAKLLLEEGRN